MYEIAKHEFATWIDSLNPTKLTEYEKTIIKTRYCKRWTGKVSG